MERKEIEERFQRGEEMFDRGEPCPHGKLRPEWLGWRHAHHRRIQIDDLVDMIDAPEPDPDAYAERSRI